MARFQTKADLSAGDQAELDRISAIASAQRTSVEAAFLTARADYLYNEILLSNAAGEIVIAAGRTLPTGFTGFSKGAMFIKTNETDGKHTRYENLGDATTPIWDGEGIADEAEEAPVNAVNAISTLTASSVTAGVRAESVITSDTTNVSDGETVTIGSTVYRFKDTMAAINDVQIGASAAATLDNLKHAINGTGVAGTNWFAGTVAHTLVVATDNTDTTQKVVARATGTSANTLATTETSDHLSWPDTTLGGGTGASNAGVAGDTVTVGNRTYTIVTELAESITSNAAIINEVLKGVSDATCLDNIKSAINGSAGAGTTYATGTQQPTADVSATTNTDTTQAIEADVAGVSGNGLAATTATGGLSFDKVEVDDGVDGTVGDKGEQIFTSSYLYTAIEDNGVADKNWRRVSLGSAY